MLLKYERIGVTATAMFVPDDVVRTDVTAHGDGLAELRVVAETIVLWPWPQQLQPNTCHVHSCNYSSQLAP
jgi:hypothetical protein